MKKLFIILAILFGINLFYPLFLKKELLLKHIQKIEFNSFSKDKIKSAFFSFEDSSITKADLQKSYKTTKNVYIYNNENMDSVYSKNGFVSPLLISCVSKQFLLYAKCKTTIITHYGHDQDIEFSYVWILFVGWIKV